MFYVLSLLNLAILIFGIFSFKNNHFMIFGGSLTLIIVIAAIGLFQSLLKQFRTEFQTMISLLIAILGWQYLNYYEINNLMDYTSIIWLFSTITIIIYVLFFYIFLRPIYREKIYSE